MNRNLKLWLGNVGYAACGVLIVLGFYWMLIGLTVAAFAAAWHGWAILIGGIK